MLSRENLVCNFEASRGLPEQVKSAIFVICARSKFQMRAVGTLMGTSREVNLAKFQNGRGRAHTLDPELVIFHGITFRGSTMQS